MSLEVEAKMKVESHDPFRAKLSELGAVKLGKIKETNQLFDDQKGSLRDGGTGLRIRHVENLDGPPVSPSITYKGPVMNAQFKTRPEIETQIDDADSAVRIFQALGYETFITFEKIRESWQLGSCKIELDELPLLGKFIEIEGKDEAVITEAKTSLGLASTPHISKGYVSMLIALCQSAGIDSRVIRF